VSLTKRKRIIQMEIKRRLKKVEAEFISLVGKGANNKIIIFKAGQNTGGFQVQKQVDIKKVDEDQRMVYGIVYSPDEVDLQGDIASAEVIKEMAYSFMKNAKTNNIDQQHNFISDEGFVAESWLTKAGDSVFPLEKEGSWAVGIKIEKEETWQLIKSGEITGLSLAGLAVVEEVKKTDVQNKTLYNFFEKIRKMFSVKKDFNSAVNQSAVRDYLYALEKTVDDVLSDETGENKKAAIMDGIARFTEAMNGLEISKGEDYDHNKDNITAGNQTGEKEITILELEKMIGESINSVSEKIEALKKINEDLALRVAAIEKSTPGSRQAVKKEQINPNQLSIWT
jgi:hypothetical protein